MGNGSSRPGYYTPPRNPYSDRPMRGEYQDISGYEPGPAPYQYPQMYYPQPYAQQPYPMFQQPYMTGPMPPPPIPPGHFAPVPATNPNPVIPNMHRPHIPQTQTSSSVSSVIPARRHHRTPSSRPTHTPVQMPVPSPAPPVMGSVIPPIPPVPSGFVTVSSSVPPLPVFPNVQTPGHQSATPVVPPTPIMMPQPGATPGARRRPRAAPEATPRPRWSRLFPRPVSLHFMRHPLPAPPESILERPQYVGLLDELRRDPEEKLRSMPQGLRYFVVPTQAAAGVAAPGMPIVPVVPAVPLEQGGSHASRERQPKKGLFRTLSDALGRKSRSRREHDEAHHRQHHHHEPVAQHMIYASSSGGRQVPVGVSLRDQGGPVIPNVGYAGGTPMPMRAPSVRMPSPAPSGRPSVQMPSPAPSGRPSVRAPSPAHSMHAPARAPSPAYSMHASLRAPSPAYSTRGAHPPPRVSSPAHSTHGPAQTPSHMRAQSPQLQIVIEAVSGLAGLIHTSPHEVNYKGAVFPTAFHLLESLRFSDPALVELIRHSRTVEDVRTIVNQNHNQIRPDWENVVLDMMDIVLYHKFTQHPDLLDLLFRTGVADLVFSDRDHFWGNGSVGNGDNELGKALMRLREKLRVERAGYRRD